MLWIKIKEFSLNFASSMLWFFVFAVQVLSGVVDVGVVLGGDLERSLELPGDLPVSRAWILCRARTLTMHVHVEGRARVLHWISPNMKTSRISAHTALTSADGQLPTLMEQFLATADLNNLMQRALIQATVTGDWIVCVRESLSTRSFHDSVFRDAVSFVQVSTDVCVCSTH